jgi:hypothetical protein
MTGTLVCAQIAAARLRNTNRRLRITNAFLWVWFAIGLLAIGHDAWHAPAGRLSLLP